MTRQISRLTFATLAALIALGLVATDTQAQVSKAFKISGSGVAPEGIPLPGDPPRPHWIVGQATHLGRHSGSGSVQTESADFSQFPECITGTFGSGSPFEFVGANGDKLVCEYGRDENGNPVGTFKLNILDIGPGGLLVEAIWLADFVAQGDLSTGKFAGVSGSWTMDAISEPFILGSADPAGYSWHGSGRLTFQR